MAITSCEWHGFVVDGKAYAATYGSNEIIVYEGTADSASDEMLKGSCDWYNSVELARNFCDVAIYVADAVGAHAEFRRDVAAEVAAIRRYRENVVSRDFTDAEASTVRAIRTVVAAFAGVARDDVRVRVEVDHNNDPPTESFTLECFRAGSWSAGVSPCATKMVSYSRTLASMDAQVRRCMEIEIERARVDAQSARQIAKATAERETELRNAMAFMPLAAVGDEP